MSQMLFCRASAYPRSTEGEAKRLRAWIEKVDGEISIANGFGLPYQLIHPLLRHRAVALLIDVSAMRGAGYVSIDQNAKPHALSRN